MAVLRLYIDESWPQHDRACDWALLDAGRVVQRGRSAPEHWPGGKSVTSLEAALDPGQLSVHSVALPTRARQALAQLAAMALEDRLLEEPERYHFVPAGRFAPDGETRVLVILRSRLSALIAALAQLRPQVPPLRRLVAAADLLPRERDAWTLWPAPAGRWVLAASATGCFSLAEAAEAIPLLAAGGAPGLLACGAKPGPMPLPVIEAPLFDWATGEWPAATNLLCGPFAPPGRHPGWQSWRPVAWTTALLAAAYGLLTVVEWIELSRRETALKAEIRQLASRALPGEPLATPLVQLLAAADAQRHRAGQAGRGDLPALATVLAEALGPVTVTEMNYAPGRIEWRVEGLTADRARAAREILARSGLDLRTAPAASGLHLTVGWWLAGRGK
jgi:type II secretion system protein L